ncbi:MAG: hypothetical protein BVN28_05985 [Nitrospira sp. ST-bin4]|nr:MAG: hypothetical protein BVN28_05985 [Nitrospira sp. ST-bin4]
MPEAKGNETGTQSTQDKSFQISPPAITLPKGGGAIRGMGEKFAANPVTGTGSMSVPIATSQGRGGFGPQLSLSYDSGAGNGPFGLGWNLSLPSITRKTDKGLPLYRDEQESDVFILAGAEDLVPVSGADGSPLTQTIPVHGVQYRVRTYRPRIEGLFTRIERWVRVGAPSDMFWRTLSKDNITTWYGKTAESRITDPNDSQRIFQWLICETHDDKGNVVTYHYQQDDAAGVVTTSVEESNRTVAQRTANRYLDRIRYGNLKPYLPKLAETGTTWPGPNDVPGQRWMFEVVFDYSAPGGVATPTNADVETRTWFVRADPFSTHRAGFEVRTYRLCRRVLMFHHFEELGTAACLVRSTDFGYAQQPALKNPEKPGYTTLQSVTQRAYQKRDLADTDYESRQWPPVSFTYSEPRVDTTVHTIAQDQLENLPVGTQGPGYQWLDLDGEGLSGVLATQAGGWYYKPNRGDGEFGPLRAVVPQPAMALAAGSRHQFMDLAGNGAIDVVDFGGPTPGFHERDGDTGWKQHVPFARLPNIDWQDPNLRFVDLTGDGHADALITEGEVFTWYPSLEERGFAASERTRTAQDEDAGPRLVFADGTQTIFLADMCGDGLTDLVRIRNGEVCYWPNQGYGRFGRKITLGNSPRFDHPDQFDPARIRLTDIDGSGPIDIIYLGRGGAQLYFNRSGNSLSDGFTVALPVATENLGAVQVADLLGNGTACLVWNSHLPADAGRPVRYIDLMAGVRNSPEDRQAQRKHEKPHLLIRVENNLGATTEIEYTPSTRFYLQDLKAGTPWVTRLPFPVQCVSKVTVRDQWRGTSFSSTYSYHHGYFDGAEREFRGFGRVEQIDIENYGEFAEGNAASPWITQDKTLYQPPVKTITWYHTGAAIDRQHILTQFATEYFPQRYADRLPDPVNEPDAFRENPLPEPELPASLSADEWREALRACRGMVLRQEIYELDVDDLTVEPPRHTPVRLYSAATHNCHIQILQPRGPVNRHAVFLVTESEAISYHYELAIPKGNAPLAPDPRIAHTLNLAIDEYGNILEAAAAVYPRIGSHADATLTPEQRALINQVQKRERHLALNYTRYTRDIDSTHVRRLRMPCQTQSWEVTGINPAGQYFTLAELKNANLPGSGVQEISYHQIANGTSPQKRLIECARSLFFADDLINHRPFGEHGPLGLAYESYKLALTKELISRVYVGSERINAAITALDEKRNPGWGTVEYPISGYYKGDALFAGHDITPEPLADQYWMASGRAGFEGDAAAHFYLPERYTDPFGNLTTLKYDKRDLFVQSSTDAMGNTTGIAMEPVPNNPLTERPRFDYRVLAPIEMVDANGNHSEAVSDIRGLVVAAAIKGKKVNGHWEGDHLDGWTFDDSNPPETAVAGFCLKQDYDAAQEQQARTWLGTATTRFVYHFGEGRDNNGIFTGWADRPAGACGIVRERHVTQVALDPLREHPLQVSLECSDGGGNVLMKKVQAEPEQEGGPLRWIINGLTVLNNKGKPVKQYEPAFSADFGCELPTANGVTPIIYYDAAGRVVRTEMPDGTFSRVEFSPWHVKTFDANDTAFDPKPINPNHSDWYKRRTDPAHPLFAEFNTPENSRAADLVKAHADTPSETHLDSLGREVIAIAHNRTNGVDETYTTFTKLDAEGKPLWIRDARGNLVMQYISPAKANNDVSNAMPANGVPCYDIAGNLLFQHSMDAGDRWMLMDAAGKPMLAWDINDKGAGTPQQQRTYRIEYDALHRPVKQWLTVDSNPSALVEAFEYLDTSSFKNAQGVIDQAALRAAQGKNLIGQAVKHWDPSGLATVERIDLSGKPAHITRRLIKPDADGTTGLLGWPASNRENLLDAETFHQITEYDALGRMTKHFNWHRLNVPRMAIYQPRYNRRGLLESEALLVRASNYSADTTNAARAITSITYNAKGQKEQLTLGNGTLTQYDYDPLTFRLRQLRTSRPANADDFPQLRSNLTNPNIIQQLLYTYDPVGNITEVEDQAYKPVFFDNGIAEPKSLYEYDALYRLISATGRETAQGGDAARNGDEPVMGSGFPINDQTLRRYEQVYEYDQVGNFVTMQHRVPTDTAAGWTRGYDTHLDNNRLHRTWYGAPDWGHAAPNQRTEYRYDTHGNMLNLANVAPGQQLQWDHRDMIRSLDLGGGGVAHYQYDAGKQRTRKRIVNQNGLGGYWERIYLGGYERYRRYNGSNTAPVEEIESHHLFEGEQRVLLVDDVIATNRTHADGRNYRTGTLYRYQYSNHLGSACLELDHQAAIISYEEYHPYGTSAYRAMKHDSEASAKRYRYTGMERDEESGLSYHRARFYLSWLARWSSVDSTGVMDGLNLYTYVHGRPNIHVDSTGNAGDDPFAAAKEGLEWERFILGKVGEKIPLVQQVNVKAKIGNETVTTVLDGLGLGVNGLEVIESKLNPSTTLRKGQRKLLDHIKAGGTFEIAVLDKEKLIELSSKLHVSPKTKLAAAGYHVVNRGNANEVLQTFKVIESNELMVFVKSGKFVKATKDEMLQVEKLIQGKPAYVEDALTAVRETAAKAKQKAEYTKKSVGAVNTEEKAAAPPSPVSEYSDVHQANTETAVAGSSNLSNALNKVSAGFVGLGGDATADQSASSAQTSASQKKIPSMVEKEEGLFCSILGLWCNGPSEVEKAKAAKLEQLREELRKCEIKWKMGGLCNEY